MGKKIDKIVVIDLESTCWDEAPPAGQVSDIIEIGLCVVDVAKLERGEKRSLMIRPARSEVSEFCTQLTTITPEMVAEGMELEQACKILKSEYKTKSWPWASWGDYDREQLELCCGDLDIDYPFGSRHLNVKTLFGLVCGEGREMGLDCAYQKLGLRFEGTHHRGHDDAWNIAGVLVEVLRWSRTGLNKKEL